MKSDHASAELKALMFCVVTPPLQFFFHCIVLFPSIPELKILGPIAGHGYKGVWVFYVLSGFIIPYSISHNRNQMLSVKNFLLRRLVRIQPSYLTALALSIFLLGFLLENPDYLDISTIVINSFYAAPFTDYKWLLSISWSLGVEAQFYVFIAIFYPYITSKTNQPEFHSFSIYKPIPCFKRTARISLVFVNHLVSIFRDWDNRIPCSYR